MRDNPYTPPQTDAGAAPIVIDRRRVMAAFVAWLVGASIVIGVVSTLQAGFLLGRVGAEVYAGSVLVISAFRVHAVHVAASAASVALVVATHRRSSASASPRRSIPGWTIHAAVPLAMPIAAVIMLATGVGTAAVFHDVTAVASWKAMVEITRVTDLLFGTASAVANALVLGLVAAVAMPRLAAVRWGIAAKIVTALIVTALVTSTIGGIATAIVAEEQARSNP